MIPSLLLSKSSEISKEVAVVGIQTVALEGLTLKIKGMIQDAI